MDNYPSFTRCLAGATKTPLRPPDSPRSRLRPLVSSNGNPTSHAELGPRCPCKQCLMAGVPGQIVAKTRNTAAAAGRSSCSDGGRVPSWCQFPPRAQATGGSCGAADHTPVVLKSTQRAGPGGTGTAALLGIRPGGVEAEKHAQEAAPGCACQVKRYSKELFAI